VELVGCVSNLGKHVEDRLLRRLHAVYQVRHHREYDLVERSRFRFPLRPLEEIDDIEANPLFQRHE
jgi:hypothetical protein